MENGDMGKNIFSDLLKQAKELLNIKKDSDYQGTTDYIIANVDFKAANAWTLVFAIFIASIGLKLNSPAVIIGAMLISPLMGPIIGVGYCLATNDFDLLKRCLMNLLFAIGISVITSAFFFLFFPIVQPQTEILQRIHPTFFDVMTAFFGGAAGFVALSRYEKSNVIPGVAIATALMPPLCVTGFGIAKGSFEITLGAFYLFIINCVFISISTFLLVKYLRFPLSKYFDAKKRQFIGKIIGIVAFSVTLPSLIFAFVLHQREIFQYNVKQYIGKEFSTEHYIILDRAERYNFLESKLKLTILSKDLSEEEIEKLKQKATLYSLDPKNIEINQSSIWRSSVLENVNQVNQLNTEEETKLKSLLAEKDKELSQFKEVKNTEFQLKKELSIINRNIVDIHLSLAEGGLIQALILWKARPTKQQTQQILKFIGTKFETNSIELSHSLAIGNR